MSKLEKELQEIVTDVFCAFKNEHPAATYISVNVYNMKAACVTWTEGGMTREIRWGVDEDGRPCD